jgi:hypothetical protein
MAWRATQWVTVRDRAVLESGSGGEAFVALMKPADLRNRDHLAAVRRLDWASIRAIFVEREMGPRAMIVVDVREQDAAQIALLDHEYMIQALTGNRADDPWRRNDLCDPHNPSPLLKNIWIGFGFGTRPISNGSSRTTRCFTTNFAVIPD